MVATIFIRALLNFVGVAMMIPLLMVILDGNSIMSIAPLHEAYDLFGCKIGRAHV